VFTFIANSLLETLLLAKESHRFAGQKKLASAADFHKMCKIICFELHRPNEQKLNTMLADVKSAFSILHKSFWWKCSQ